MSPDDPRHGTTAGYKAHLNAGAPTCQPCKDAAARYERGRQWDRWQGRVRYLDATGTTRRLRALSAMGWSLSLLVMESGLPSSAIAPALAGRRTWVTRKTAEAAAEMFVRLSMTLGPSNSARIRAARKGWLPPLAWDDIDDPAEQPGLWETQSFAQVTALEPDDYRVNVGMDWDPCDVDEVVVFRILGGEHRLVATDAERAEVARRWPGSLSDLERLTGWNIHRDRREAAA